MIFSSSGGGGSSKIKIIVVDEDQTAGSREFLTKLQATPEFQIETDTRDSATERVRKGDRTAFIALPKGFGDARERMFFGEPMVIQAGLDPARQAEAGMIQGVLAQNVYENHSYCRL